MTTYNQDHFTGTNGDNLASGHTPDVGGNWTNSNGTWTIQGNKAQPPAATGDALALVDAGVADGITLTLPVDVPNASDYAVGLAPRSTDQNNLWRCSVQRDGSGTARICIVERTLSAQNERAFANFVSAPHGTTRTLTVTLAGDVITLTADTGETCNYTSSVRNTETTHGIWAYTDFGYSGGTVDDYLVADTVTPPVDMVPFTRVPNLGAVPVY